MTIAPYLKALVGAAIAGLASLQQALDGDNTVTSSEWVAVAVAFFGAALAVFYIPYQTTVKPDDEGGQVDVGLMLLVGTFVGVVLLLFRVHFG